MLIGQMEILISSRVPEIPYKHLGFPPFRSHSIHTFVATMNIYVDVESVAENLKKQEFPAFLQSNELKRKITTMGLQSE
jgi:hypothetical protein